MTQVIAIAAVYLARRTALARTGPRAGATAGNRRMHARTHRARVGRALVAIVALGRSRALTATFGVFADIIDASVSGSCVLIVTLKVIGTTTGFGSIGAFSTVAGVGGAIVAVVAIQGRLATIGPKYMGTLAFNTSVQRADFAVVALLVD